LEPSETTIRARLTEIISDLWTTPDTMTATLVTQEYAKRHGPDGCVEAITATLLAELFEPTCRPI
jgi:hypothetical protein